jgi:uncharacterized protein
MKMKRLFILLIILFPLIVAAQKGPFQKKKTVPVKAKAIDKDRAFSDSLRLDSFSKVNADMILATIDSLLVDSAFIASLVDTLLSQQAASKPYDQVERMPTRPLGWISDYEGIFTDEEITSLDSIVAGFEAKTSIEVAIVTLDSSWTTPERFDRYVLGLHNSWGVGKKDKKNGIVIGLSAGLRRIRISNGYGIESRLTDQDTKAIIEETIIPQFRESNYFEGVRQGLLAIIQKLK